MLAITRWGDEDVGGDGIEVFKFRSTEGASDETRRDDRLQCYRSKYCERTDVADGGMAWYASSRWFLYVLYGLLNTYGTNVTKLTGFFLLLFFSNGEILRIIQGKFCK